MTQTSYSLRVEGCPRPWTVQVRRAKRSPGFEAMQSWQAAIQAAIVETFPNRQPLEGPVSLCLEFYLPLPKACPQRHGPRTNWLVMHQPKKFDNTNLTKACEDALARPHPVFGQMLILNDSQVVHTQAWKYWDMRPGGQGHTEITVAPA